MDRVFSLPSIDRHSAPPTFSAGEVFDRWPVRALAAPLTAIVDRLLALPTLERLYRALPAGDRPFWDRALEALEIGYDVSAQEAACVPASGPLVVVANHPYGAADGLVLASLLSRTRPDVRLLGNHLLGRIPELRRLLIPVNVYGGARSTAGNGAALRAALKWVRAGGALAVFPAGEVSHAASRGAAVADPAWAPAIAVLAQRAGASVLPVFFEGSNSRLFQAAGRLHPTLRTALLVRELLKLAGRRIRVRVGSPIPASRVAAFSDPQDAAAFLRVRTYALGGADRRLVPAEGRAIASPEPGEAIATEINALPPSRILNRSGAFTICVAHAHELPHGMRELGRLRELAFRAVGEGSGKERDLDGFDEHYLHLIVWNHDRREIVGSYRMGQTDVILPRLGIDGLYTSTLFRYDRRLLQELGPALELGRAFVRPEYQRDYSPLLLLWKGIGSFVAKHPRYRVLFGTVSISSEYQSLSRQILAKFLYATSYRADLATWIEPRNPPPFARSMPEAAPIVATVARSVADVGALVAAIEADGKGVPVLLRQYLKLNARLLGFNIDSAFGGVLDGLMMVDLRDVHRDLLIRYMGREGAERFCAVAS